MIMINDYLKINKLNMIITGIVLIIFGVLQFVHIVFAKLLVSGYFIIHPIQRSFYEQVSTIIFVSTILISLLFISNILSIAIGNKRKLILIHYGKSYYIKFVLSITVLFSIVLLAILSINSCLNSYEYYAYDIQGAEIGKVIDSMFKPIIDWGTNISLAVFFIIIVFSCIYLIDLFKNCDNRYNSIMIRNIRIIRFIFRYCLIWLCGFSLYLSSGLLPLNYENDYTKLIVQPSPYQTNYLTLIIVFITVTLIIDYYCFFKKKVLV